MTGKFQVISERLDAYTGKRGRVEQRLLALLDLGDPPLVNTVDYALTKDEEAKYPKDLKGKTVTLSVTDVRPAFGGRLRLFGGLQSVQ